MMALKRIAEGLLAEVVSEEQANRGTVATERLRL